MKSNEELQKDVQNAIKWERLLHVAEIGVTAKDGVITLSGNVDSLAKKMEAENATKSVAGVKAVVENIIIKFSSDWNKSDSEVANEVLNALRSNWEIPHDKIKVKVENGWVELEGQLEWNFQKEEAKKAIQNLAGIIGVTNNITIKSLTTDAIEKKDIEKALKRNWSIDDQEIHVDVHENKVTLTGIVESWYQREEAGRIAWNAPGVWNVTNDLMVEYDYSLID